MHKRLLELGKDLPASLQSRLGMATHWMRHHTEQEMTAMLVDDLLGLLERYSAESSVNRPLVYLIQAKLLLFKKDFTLALTMAEKCLEEGFSNEEVGDTILWLNEKINNG